MEFTNEFIKNLTPNKLGIVPNVTITGANYLGQPFTTIGFVMGRDYIDSDSLGLCLGQHKGRNFNYLTFFNTYQGDGRRCMYIKSIFDKNNNEIYSNADFDEIMQNIEAYKSAVLSTSSQTIPTSEMENLIAKPITLNNKGYALKSVRLTQTGEAILECTDGTISSSFCLPSPSKIKLDTAAISSFAPLEEPSENE